MFTGMTTSFFAILLLELFDKSQLLTAALAIGKTARDRIKVFFGASAALVIATGLVIVGGDQIRTTWEIPSTLFLASAVALLLIGRWGKLGSASATAQLVPQQHLTFTTFTLVFLGELGDKTQLGGVGLAHHFSLLPTLLGATCAMVVSTGAAVLFASAWNEQRLSRPDIREAP